jgi:hypothetical protein
MSTQSQTYDGQQNTSITLVPGLLISIIAIDNDTIGDIFEVSLSAILFFGCIAIDYRDTFRKYRSHSGITENY